MSREGWILRFKVLRRNLFLVITNPKARLVD